MLKQYLKKAQKSFEKKIKGNSNSVLKKPYLFFSSVLRPFYFSNEFLMLKGLKRKTKSKKQSIIFFTVHKSASTFVKNLIFDLESKSLKPISFASLLTPTEQEMLFNEQSKMKKILEPTGYVFGAFRMFYNLPDLEDYKIVLLLRDPRDVLTSQYFSTLYNHPLARKGFFEKRKRYQDYTIDDFVLEMADSLQVKYAEYLKNIVHRPNTLFLKYEEMVTNFDEWLHKLSKFLELKNNENKLQQIIESTSFKVKENKHNFIRNITPGDHKNKLKSETIEKLNTLFSKELQELNYAV